MIKKIKFNYSNLDHEIFFSLLYSGDIMISDSFVYTNTPPLQSVSASAVSKTGVVVVPLTNGAIFLVSNTVTRLPKGAPDASRHPLCAPMRDITTSVFG